MGKITKPTSCNKCPAYIETKKTVKCNVGMWEIKKGDRWEEYKKWSNCPVDWDE